MTLSVLVDELFERSDGVSLRDFACFGELYRHDVVTESGERNLPEGRRDHARTWVRQF